MEELNELIASPSKALNTSEKRRLIHLWANAYKDHKGVLSAKDWGAITASFNKEAGPGDLAHSAEQLKRQVRPPLAFSD